MKQVVLQVISVILVTALLLSFEMKNIACIFLSVINGATCVKELLSYRDRPYSIHKLVNIFILIFFVIANMLQYSNGSRVTSIFIRFSSNEYAFFQIVVFFILLVFNGLYKTIYKKSTALYGDSMVDTCGITCNETLLLVISMVAFMLIFAHYGGNINRLMFRGSVDNIGREIRETNVSSNLLFGKIIRPIPMVCYVIGCLANVSKKKRFFLFSLMLISLFPSGLARNAAAMFWMPVVLLKIKIIEKGNWFSLSMLLGLLVLFPLMDQFRYYNGQFKFAFDFDYLDTMNFDASQEFMASVKLNFITWGRQLLGVLFFFVPRSIWPTKPIGSGATLASRDFAFSNISMPYFAEGYVNFGWIGVFLFTVILAVICVKMDNKYWRSKGRNYAEMWWGIYYIIVGAMIFILRGDLMSSFAFTTGTVVSYWGVSKVVLVKKVVKN